MELFDLIAALEAQPSEAGQAAFLGAALKGHRDPKARLKLLTGERGMIALGRKALEDLLAQPLDPSLAELSEAYTGSRGEALALMWHMAGRANPNRPVTAEWLAQARGEDMIRTLFDATPHQYRPLLFDMIAKRWTPPLTPRAAITGWALATGRPLAECAADWHDDSLPPYGFRLPHPVERTEQATLDGWPEWNWRGIKLILSSDPAPGAYTGRGEALPGMVATARALPPFTQVEAVMLALDAEQAALRRRAKSALKPKDCPAIEVTDLLVAEGEVLTGLPYKARLDRLARLALLPPFQRTAYDPETPNSHSFGTIHKSADALYGDPHLPWTVVPPVRKTIKLMLLSWQRGAAGLGIDWGQATARLGEAPPPADGKVLQAIKAHVKAHTVARHGPVHEMERTAPLVLRVSATALTPAPRRTAGFVLREPRIEGLAEGGADSLGVIRKRFSPAGSE